jgi:3-oxoacyl-[acyl-carrier protein] reductase
MDLGLADKVVFVTGASGGIGKELCRAFEAEGARVAACSRRGVPAGDRVMSLLGDVTRPADMESAMQRAVDAWGRVDVCVANAGIWPADALALDELPEARVREVVDVNLLGTIWTARAFLSALRRSGPRPDGHGASLVLIGSTAGRFGEPGHAEYAATKAALSGLMLSLKNEIVRIDPAARVNLVEPGWTATPMAAATLERDGILDQVTRTMPLRRVASPDDVAGAVIYFASPVLSRHVSGETLTVAGGMEGRVLR